jgi:hypothetical protein
MLRAAADALDYSSGAFSLRPHRWPSPGAITQGLTFIFNLITIKT